MSQNPELSRADAYLSKWVIRIVDNEGEKLSRRLRLMFAFATSIAAILLTTLLQEFTGFYSAMISLAAMCFIALIVDWMWALLIGALMPLVLDYFLIPPVGHVLTDIRESQYFGLFFLMTVVIVAVIRTLKIAFRSAALARAEAESARREAERASESKTLFLSNVSHEIRTPLNGIIGLAQMLGRSPLNESQMRSLKTVQQLSQQLLGLLNDVLDLGRIESGKLELNVVMTDLGSLAREVHDWFVPLAKNKGLTFQIHVAVPDGFQFALDPQRFRQVLTNLVSNAVKFTQKGTVRLSVIADSPDFRGYSHVVCRVEDTGIGIPESAQNRIFETFYQANGTATRPFGGSGLGLAIVRQLLDLMGGDVSIESREGQGSVFTVRTSFFAMPVAERGSAVKSYAPVESGLPVLPVRTEHRILIVEDNEVSQEVCRAVIESAGYQAEVVSSGQSAVEACRTGDYSLVLMDCQMPGMDGYEATRILRESGHHLPVIALTAHAFQEDRERCLRAGMNDYLSKPFSEEQLIAVVDSYVLGVGPILDLSRIQRLEGLDRSGSRGLIKRLCDLYRADAPKALEAMAKAAGKSDAQGVRDAAHKFKSANQNLGLVRVGRVLERLEVPSLPAGTMQALLKELDTEVVRALVEVDKLSPGQEDFTVS